MNKLSFKYSVICYPFHFIIVSLFACVCNVLVSYILDISYVKISMSYHVFKLRRFQHANQTGWESESRNNGSIDLGRFESNNHMLKSILELDLFVILSFSSIIFPN